MNKRAKTIAGLACCEPYGTCTKEQCPYYHDNDCLHSLLADALTLLKKEAPKKVRAKGNVSVSDIQYGECPWCGGDVLSNAHPHHCGHCGKALQWDDAPEALCPSMPAGKVLQGFLLDLPSANSILNSINFHALSLEDASRIIAVCACACDVMSPSAFIRWLKERMMQDVCLRGCVEG